MLSLQSSQTGELRDHRAGAEEVTRSGCNVAAERQEVGGGECQARGTLWGSPWRAGTSAPRCERLAPTLALPSLGPTAGRGAALDESRLEGGLEEKDPVWRKPGAVHGWAGGEAGSGGLEGWCPLLMASLQVPVAGVAVKTCVNVLAPRLVPQTGVKPCQGSSRFMNT